jgi:hypothetical protein
MIYALAHLMLDQIALMHAAFPRRMTMKPDAPTTLNITLTSTTAQVLSDILQPTHGMSVSSRALQYP